MLGSTEDGAKKKKIKGLLNCSFLFPAACGMLMAENLFRIDRDLSHGLAEVTIPLGVRLQRWKLTLPRINSIAHERMNPLSYPSLCSLYEMTSVQSCL